MFASQSSIPTEEMFNNTSELMSQMSAADGAVSGKRASGKRGSRGPRYDDKTLSEVVRELLPTYSEEWKMVAKEYHSLSLEVEERPLKLEETLL